MNKQSGIILLLALGAGVYFLSKKRSFPSGTQIPAGDGPMTVYQKRDYVKARFTTLGFGWIADELNAMEIEDMYQLLTVYGGDFDNVPAGSLRDRLKVVIDRYPEL